jgi:hypothetical protein
MTNRMTTTIASLLVSTGAMASPPDALDHLVATSATAPETVGACGPIAELPAAMASRPTLHQLVNQAAGHGAAGQLLDAALTERWAGLDPTGAVAVAEWSDGSHRVELPYTGTAATLASELGLGHMTGNVWAGIRDGEPVAIALLDDRLILAEQGFASQPGLSQTSVALQGADLERTCVWTGAADGMATASIVPFDASLPDRVRVDGRMGRAAVAASAAPAFDVSTTTVPDAVLTLGVAWLDVASTLWTHALPTWAELPIGVWAGPSATVASFGRQADAELVLVVPVYQGVTPISTRALHGALGGAEAHGHVAFDGDLYRAARGEVWLAAAPGALVVGTDPTLVAQVVDGHGQAWVDADLRRLALTAPIAAAVANGDGQVTRFTGYAEGNGWELVAEQPGSTPDPAAWRALVGALDPAHTTTRPITAAVW